MDQPARAPRHFLRGSNEGKSLERLGGADLACEHFFVDSNADLFPRIKKKSSSKWGEFFGPRKSKSRKASSVGFCLEAVTY